MGTATGFRKRIAVVVALAFAVRVAVVLATPGFVPRTDAADYDRIAVSLARHGTFPRTLLAAPGGPTAYRPPLFPGMLAVLDKVVGTGSTTTRWEAGRLLESVLGAVAVLLVCLIAARVWDRRVALVAGVIAAVFPPLVLVGSSLLAESLFIPLVLGAVLAALRHRAGGAGVRWALAAGALTGLAALTRSNGIALAVPLGFLVWCASPRRSRAAAAAPAALVGAAIAVLIPWTVRNAVVMHAFVPISTESGYVAEGTYNQVVARDTRYPGLWAPPVQAVGDVLARHPDAAEPQVTRALEHEAVHYARAHPTYVATVAFWGTVRTLGITPGFERLGAVYESYPGWLVDLSVYAYWVVGLAALAGVFLPAARRGPPAFWGVPLTIVLSFIFVEGSIRFRSPTDPFVVMLAAAALTTAGGRAAAGGRANAGRRLRRSSRPTARP